MYLYTPVQESCQFQFQNNICDDLIDTNEHTALLFLFSIVDNYVVESVWSLKQTLYRKILLTLYDIVDCKSWLLVPK